MARRRILLITLLACMTTFSCGDLYAQARGPRGKVLSRPALDLNDPVQRDAMMEKLGAWLRRMVGEFRYDGFVQFGFGDERLVKGTQDCTSIGDGPGAHCVTDMSWPEISAMGMHGPISYLQPAVTLYGIGPTAADISFMQVDARSWPEGVTARLRSGDVVRFQVPCVNAPAACRTIIRITARPDDTPIQLKIDRWSNYFGDMSPGTTFILSLHRKQESVPESGAAHGNSVPDQPPVR